MNLITPDERAAYAKPLDDVFDTFARDIIVWQSSSEIINIPVDDNTNDDYDAFYDKPIGNQSTISYTPISNTIPAMIKYVDRSDDEFGLAIASAKDEIDVRSVNQIVRIKIRAIDKSLLNDAEKITVDGADFRILSSPRPHGLLTGLDYYTYYLRNRT